MKFYDRSTLNKVSVTVKDGDNKTKTFTVLETDLNEVADVVKKALQDAE